MSSSSRLEFLDFLRCIAAFAVILQHSLESNSPAFANFCTYYFQFGVFGVTLFFLTSGFIIPVSLEKNNSLRAFWISRIFRLFPLYLTSIVVSLGIIYFGLLEGTLPSALGLFANLIMLAKFMGQPLVLGLYWTLNLEMVFYFLVTGLFLIGFLKRSTLLAILALVSAVLVGVVGTRLLHLFDSGWGLIFQLATMFVGTVYYRYMSKQVSKKTWTSIIVMALLVLFAITYFNLYNQDKPEALGTRSFWPVTNAFLLAYLLFTLCFSARKFTFPKPFLFLGMISYSLYLVQANVLPFVISHVPNVYLSTFLSIGITVLVSFGTYSFIEKPFVKLGHKLAKKEALKVSPTIVS